MTKPSEIKLLDRTLLTRAAADAFRKLHPRHMARNPVMFVVEAGAVLATLALLGVGTGGSLSFQLQVVLWLWATVLFANFAEAVAEGRGKAQADSLRRTKTDSVARRLVGPKGARRASPPPRSGRATSSSSR